MEDMIGDLAGDMGGLMTVVEDLEDFKDLEVEILDFG